MKLSSGTKKILAVIVVAGILIGSWAVWYVFFKPHRDVSSEKPAFEMTADALAKAFGEDGNAMATYLDKAIMIEGTVTEVGESNIVLGNIICNFEEANVPKPGKVNVGQSVKIQGRVSTYNDLMEEIIIDKCVVK
jgi:hypothetical protein